MPESLKNVLLVMSSAGLLLPPHELDAQKEAMKVELWEQTWKRLERFLPSLKKELYPPESLVKKQPAAEVTLQQDVPLEIDSRETTAPAGDTGGV